MDEVDKIIIHSLRELGCLHDTDDESFDISSFTPELLVNSVAICLQEIGPNNLVPKTLPSGMAQRFTVASTLAKEMSECGYRGDIGYQTFLYPNIVDVRRIFMFLVEQLPKDNRNTSTVDSAKKLPLGDYELLRQGIKDKIIKQTRAPWLPQYCHQTFGDRTLLSCSHQQVTFTPSLNLNMAVRSKETSIKERAEYSEEKELRRNCLVHQARNIFHQTARENCDLISTVLHRNALDFHDRIEIDSQFIRNRLNDELSMTSITTVPTPTSRTETSAINNESNKNNNYDNSNQNNNTNVNDEQSDGSGSEPLTIKLSQLEQLTRQNNKLKCQNDILFVERKSIKSKMADCKAEQSTLGDVLQNLKRDMRIHERICLILDNPIENIGKLEGLIQTVSDKRQHLEVQWQSYRKPMLESIEKLKTIKQAKSMQDAMELLNNMVQLEQMLYDKSAHHAQLTMKLKNLEITAAPRKEYTRRLLEFIGNIRKQRNDIFKVLDDTRDLQKQLNTVSGQLQRQFIYTDDLLFQSAKHDLHAKKAYKLLASLHSTCNDLIELVAQTGTLTKEIRDLEDQIDRQKLKNIAISLEQISSDIQNFEKVIDNLQIEIKKLKMQRESGREREGESISNNT